MNFHFSVISITLLTCSVWSAFAMEDVGEYRQKVDEIDQMIEKGKYYHRIAELSPRETAELVFQASIQAEADLLAISVKVKRDNHFKLIFMAELLPMLRSALAADGPQHLVTGDYLSNHGTDYNRNWLPISVLMSTVHLDTVPFAYELFFNKDHTPKKEAIKRLELFLAWNLERSLEFGRVLSGTPEEMIKSKTGYTAKYLNLK